MTRPLFPAQLTVGTKFGAVLDMLCDRMATCVLCIVLSHFYAHAWGFFAFLIVLDIVSHWCQMYAKLASGAKTHKGSKNPLLNFYYTFPYALLFFCVGDQVLTGSVATLRHLCCVCGWLALARILLPSFFASSSSFLSKMRTH
jgi:phosphatidylglycerophosphate synthase